MDGRDEGGDGSGEVAAVEDHLHQAASPYGRAQDGRDHGEHEGPGAGQHQHVDDAGGLEEGELLGLLPVAHAHRDPVAREGQHQADPDEGPAVGPGEPAAVRGEGCDGLGVVDEQEGAALGEQADGGDQQDETAEPPVHALTTFPRPAFPGAAVPRTADVPLAKLTRRTSAGLPLAAVARSA